MPRHLAERAGERAADRVIAEFQSATAEILTAPEPLAARLTLWILSLMVMLAIGLAAIVPIERVVVAHGRVISQSPTIVVQPLESSIIRSIAVREGQLVLKGALLATLDPTFSQADASEAERQVASLTAEIARLEAELDRRPFAPASMSLDDQLQRKIWQSRRAEFEATLANYDQRIEAAQTAIARSSQDAAHYRTRLKMVSEIEEMRATLERNQNGSRLNTLIASDNRVEITRALNASEGSARTVRHDLEALRAAREAFQQQWLVKVGETLATTRVDLDRAREHLAKAVHRRDLVELRAVEDAMVLEVARVSVGSVVQSGERMFSLVPVNAALQVEAEIAGADQGFVKPGNLARLKFDAFRYLEHGTAKGVVRVLSADSFTARPEALTAMRSHAAPAYYRAYIDIADIGLHDVPADFRLVPGMPLKVDILVGARSILSYFVDAALRITAEGMREP